MLKECLATKSKDGFKVRTIVKDDNKATSLSLSCCCWWTHIYSCCLLLAGNVGSVVAEPLHFQVSYHTDGLNRLNNPNPNTPSIRLFCFVACARASADERFFFKT